MKRIRKLLLPANRGELQSKSVFVSHLLQPMTIAVDKISH